MFFNVLDVIDFGLAEIARQYPMKSKEEKASLRDKLLTLSDRCRAIADDIDHEQKQNDR